MSKVRMLIQGRIRDYEAFSSLAKQMCEHVEANEPDTLAYEWFADQEAGRATVHEIYATPDAFLSHFQAATERGDLDAFMQALEIEQVTGLNRVTDERVQEVAAQFGAIQLHGLAGVVR